MFSDSVAQKPTMPVNAGKKQLQNFPACGWPASNCDGCEKIGPKPPAVRYAHQSSNKPSAMSNGALMFSNQRMVSMPRWITYMLMAQEKRKHKNCPPVMPSLLVAGSGCSWKMTTQIL